MKHFVKCVSALMALVLCLTAVWCPAALAEEQLMTERVDVSDQLFMYGGFPEEQVIVPGGYGIRLFAMRSVTLEDYLYAALQEAQETIDLSSFYNAAGGFDNAEAFGATVSAAYTKVLNSHADLFYLTGGYGSSWGATYKITPHYRYAISEIKTMIPKFNAAIGKIVDYAQSCSSDPFAQVVAVNDYMCRHFEYDTTLKISDPYTFLMEGKGVCQAYMETFSAVMQQLGIASATITNHEVLNHTWNAVMIGDKWYQIDITWDDPTPDHYGYVSHTNMLMSSKKSESEKIGHTNDGFTVMPEGVVTDDTRYDNMFWDDVETSFWIDGDDFYYVRSTDEAGEYELVKWNSRSNAHTVITTFESPWTVGDNALYPDYAGAVGMYGGYVIYTTTDGVYAVPPTGGQSVKIYTPSKRISGAFIEDGKLYYATGEYVNSQDSRGNVWPIELPDEMKPKAPAFSTNPADVTAAQGKSATFTVSATGTEPVGYQWYVKKAGSADWTAISGATEATYTVSAADYAADNGSQYRCRATNTAGAVDSGAAKLTVTVAKPAVELTSSSDVSVNVEADVTFTVSATGTGLSYQWYRAMGNGAAAPIAGATASSYTRQHVTLEDSGSVYCCVVTDVASQTATSAQAKLTVNAVNPVMVKQPASQTVVLGSTATFTAEASTATENKTLTYQWYTRTGDGAWTEIAGATGSSYTTPAATLGDRGAAFKCRISNAYGAVESETATLAVTLPEMQLTKQPASQSIFEGEQATFAVEATGAELTYQWYRKQSGDFAPIAGATEATYTTEAVALTDDQSQFMCQVTDADGNKLSSDAATLTVSVKPADLVDLEIVTQPAAEDTKPGERVTLTVEAKGNGRVSYQWYADYQDGKGWQPIPGAAENSYTTPTLSAASDGWQYKCLVTDEATLQAESEVATLRVIADEPTAQPTDDSTDEPTAQPTVIVPTIQPTDEPGDEPTVQPTVIVPTVQPTDEPADEPTVQPTVIVPTVQPTVNPTPTATAQATVPAPTVIVPTVQPTAAPAAPVVVVQPKNQYAVEGQQATFEVEATGTGLTYQWYVNYNNGKGWQPIQGANTARYTTSVVKESNDGYQYLCRIKDSAGQTAESEKARLYVSAQPQVPETGDRSTPAMWLLLVLAGCAGMLAAVRWMRRRK